MSLPVSAPISRPRERAGHHPRVVAHRGASHDAAENTLAAIHRAVAVGAQTVEVDVQRSRDGALVLVHDTTLARTTDARRIFPQRAPWRVADFTYDELARLDAGSWKAAEHREQRLPTLDDALAVLAGTGTGLLLEVKAPELYPGIIGDVVATLHRWPEYLSRSVAAGSLVVQSFSYAAMKDHKTRAPELPVGLLGTPSRADLPVLAGWADQVNPSHYSVDREYVDHVHRLGMACQVWTVNRAPAMRRAVRMGVDGIITNRPDVLRRVLGQPAPGSAPAKAPAAVWPQAQAPGAPSALPPDHRAP